MDVKRLLFLGSSCIYPNGKAANKRGGSSDRELNPQINGIQLQKFLV